jgi:hypothetical protein
VLREASVPRQASVLIKRQASVSIKITSINNNPSIADPIGLRRSERESLPSRKLREAIKLLRVQGKTAHALLTVRDGSLNIP